MDKVRRTINYLKSDTTGSKWYVLVSLLALVIVMGLSISWYPIGMFECTGVRVVDTVCWTRPDDSSPGGVVWYAEQYLLLNQSMNIAVRHCGKVNNCYVVDCAAAIQVNQPGYCYTPKGDGPTIIVSGFASGFHMDGGSVNPIPLIVMTPLVVIGLLLCVIGPTCGAMIEAKRMHEQDILTAPS